MKYIFVTGGVVSGLGKGICAASLGRLLKQCGLRVRNQKFDPYLNVDPGTMSPYQHGECIVRAAVIARFLFFPALDRQTRINANCRQVPV